MHTHCTQHALDKPFNPEPMAYLIESAPPLPESALGGYRIYRHPFQVKFVNVVAVDTSDNMIAVVASDLRIDEAQQLVQMLNREFEERQ